MYTRKSGFAAALVALLLVFTTGCGKETVVSTAPVVVSTVPANGAIGVPAGQVVSATFSEPMNAATISSSTFLLVGPGTAAVTGTVAYSATGSVASFTPNVALAQHALYSDDHDRSSEHARD
jgi:hypothetical protein